MPKITGQEFENYNKHFLSAFVQIMRISELKSASNEDQEKLKKVFGLLLSEIESGNIYALYSSRLITEGILNEDVSSAIKRQAKEYIVARWSLQSCFSAYSYLV